MPNKSESKGGRPRKLEPDEKTLKLLFNLGRAKATTKDCAAFLDVSEPTFIKFKSDLPEAKETYEKGLQAGNVSLRMAQFKLAVDKLHPTMLIWLGKQHLDQRDHKDISGPNGAPIAVANIDLDQLKDMSDEELTVLEHALAKLGASSGSQSGTTEQEGE